MTEKQSAAWKKFHEYNKKSDKLLQYEEETTKYTITINAIQRDLLEALLQDEIQKAVRAFDEEAHDEEADAYTMDIYNRMQERAARLQRLIKQAKPNQ